MRCEVFNIKLKSYLHVKCIYFTSLYIICVEPCIYFVIVEKQAEAGQQLCSVLPK